jgi:methyltransferase (TIGR00027 family)
MRSFVPVNNERPASKTALMVTAYRARASQGQNPVCNDPWAEALAGSAGFALSERYDKLFPGMTLWMGLRTRFLDDCVRHYVGQGIRQIVMLGAGLDTRAARLAKLGVTFFEVDHPASQADKQRRVEALPGFPVDASVYVSCDFEHEDFLDQLDAAGFRGDSPAAFVWEGVVCYLSQEAVSGVCERIARHCHPKSVLLFDYVGKAMAQAKNITSVDQEMLDLLNELGEPVRFGTNDLTPLVSNSGFTHLRTISFDEMCLSLTGTYDRERRFRFQSIALASRTPGADPWS